MSEKEEESQIQKQEKQGCLSDTQEQNLKGSPKPENSAQDTQS